MQRMLYRVHRMHWLLLTSAYEQGSIQQEKKKEDLENRYNMLVVIFTGSLI